VVYAVVVARSAWLAEDAFITFRTVDNFISGYGLTWNVSERVQSYTHPLWMFLVSFCYLLTSEIYWTALVLSIIVSLLALTVVVVRLAASVEAAVLAVVVLTCSKAFVDYSTSGLENPLTHLLLAVFLSVYLRHRCDNRTLLGLSLLAALGMVNRMDTALLFLPPLGYVIGQLRTTRALGISILGLAPFFMWELFSLFYYGSFVPNTAYAKLNTGSPAADLISQGFHYLLNSIELDPLTLLGVVAGIAIPLATRAWWQTPVGLGVLLYLFYVVSIGGDFMSGRFLTAPLFAATTLALPHLRRSKRWLVLCLALPLISVSLPFSPLLSGADYGRGQEGHLGKRNINDERGLYYQNVGLLRRLSFDRETEFPDHWWAVRGRQVRNHQTTSGVTREGFLVAPAERDELDAVTSWLNIGLSGFYAGPRVHIVDVVALADPLLARLPSIATSSWAPGHLGRLMPEGYLETHIQGGNLIADQQLAAYYDRICLVVRGDLFDPLRWVEIWNMHWGKYDTLVDFQRYRHPTDLERNLSEIRIRPGDPTKHLVLAEAYFELGQPQEATAALHRALDINRFSFANHYIAAGICAAHQRPGVAQEIYHTAIALSSRHLRDLESKGNQEGLHVAYARLAHACVETGNRTGAVGALEAALRVKPDEELRRRLRAILSQPE
jgi:arabinofuranosyltransferase